MHRRQDLMQRQADAERDQDTGGNDDAEKDHRDRQHPAGDIAQRAVEGFLGLLLALPHLDRQFIDGADGFGLAGIDGISQELGPVCELFGQFREALSQRHGPRIQSLQGHALQVVVSEVRHHRDGFLDRLGIAAGFLGRRARQRQIIGVGGNQHGGKRLAGFSKRRPDQGVAVPGRALDDRIKSGHVPGRGQNLVLVGFRDGRLDAAQFAETVEETFGDVLQLLHRS